MAKFRWQLDPVTNLPVNVTVRALNKTIMRIAGLKPFFSAADTTGSGSTAETAAKPQIEMTRTNVQWPIYPPGMARPNDTPLIGTQMFSTGAGAVGLLQADHVFLDPLAFTGRHTGPARYDRSVAILSPPEGSTGTVMAHVNLTCT
jgi:hypothetical protein